MTFWEKVRSWFLPPRPLAHEMLHYQTPPDAAEQYRLHLRVERDGSGLLVVNAATVLHLNQTAAEYARLLVKGLDEDAVVRAITGRYGVGPAQARADYRRLRDQIITVATATDVAPDYYLDTAQVAPFSATTSAPYRVDLALTYRADESGALDPEARRRVDRELNTAEWQVALRRLWDAGVPHVVFTGGEPTLRDDLAALIRSAEELGQVAGLLSDGRRLRDMAYLDTLLQAGLDHLQITIAAPTAEVHDRLVGQAGAWEQTVAGLRNALAADIYVVAGLVLRAENAALAVDTVRFLAGLGVRAVALSSPLRAASPEEQGAWRAALEAAQEAAYAAEMNVVWDLAAPYSRVHPLELEAGLAPEQVARQHLYVEPDGDALPTQGYPVVLGNVLRDPWSSIWENPTRTRVP
jgi:MoaA/NifB/PqqE/SkfB family radical SAM enzyme